jgi:nitroreductase
MAAAASADLLPSHGQGKNQGSAPSVDPTTAATAPESVEPIGIEPRPRGRPPTGRGPKDFDIGVPVGPTPRVDFWDALYSRRSIRKFRPDPVPRELVEQLMHAGIWAPSSCNYQMWDLVAVDDPAVNAQLAALSSQMGNAPVNIIISYGRDFSEEAWANIQSASALVQNMSLAAQVLGLGTFWITQTGDREKVRELVGLPYDRLVIAVLAVGYPKIVPKQGPKRRPLSAVAHWNHYGGRAIPASATPADWHPEDLTIYQRARVLNGLRHNKPRPWEVRALEAALARLLPGPSEPLPEGQAPTRRWLDVLPCTGIVAERLAGLRPQHLFDVVERSPEVADWCLARVRPRGQALLWPDVANYPGHSAPSAGTYDVITCLFRLEDLAPADRPRLLADLRAWLKPDGRLLLAVVSSSSFHNWTEKLRRRRGGPKGVEYVLSPDPNIGPFEALDPEAVIGYAQSAGLALCGRFGTQALPQPEELDFRTRNFTPRKRRLVLGIARGLRSLERLPGVEQTRGRFQFLLFAPR